MDLQAPDQQKLQLAVAAMADAFGIEKESLWTWVQELIDALDLKVEVAVEVGPKVRVVVIGDKKTGVP